VAGTRRARILGALAEVVAERGFAGASVGLVIARARVSRRTFYECFEGLEDCFAAVIDLGSARTIELVFGAFAREDCWQDGVRAALASVLVFLDSEPLLARVWLVESLGAGSWALERRERNLRALRELVVSSWPAAESWNSPPLAAEGVISAVLGILHAHIVTGKPESLIGLLGPLMGLVAGPYMGARGIEREIERGDELARAIEAGDPRWAVLARTARQSVGLGVGREDEQGAALPAVLAKPSARRAWDCLRFLAEHPDSSNREVAVGIGMTHQSQISRLLSCLLGEHLVARRSEGAGKRNAWRLTPRGEEVVRALPGNGG
jgi:AcrR family transcriptional regulator